jgi:hypothetical protein
MSKDVKNTNAVESTELELTDVAALSAAGTYTLDQQKAKAKEKAYLKRQTKKKGFKPLPSKDFEDRKSKAQEIQERIKKGETNMAQNGFTGMKGNNVVGDAFRAGVDKVLGIEANRSYIRKKNLVPYYKDFGLMESDVSNLIEKYKLFKGRIKGFDVERIATEDEFLKLHNTVGAVVIASKATTYSTIAVEESVIIEGGQTQTRTVQKKYKGVKDKFATLDDFSHALNQIGRYTDDDLGMSVEPRWIDYTGIGIIQPGEVEAVSQRVRTLFELAGIRVDLGLVCENGSNPDIMTTSEYTTTVDDESFIAYKQRWKNVNVAELMLAAQFSRTGLFRKDNNEPIKPSLYAENYVCAFDKAYLIEKNREFLVTSLGDIR